MLSCILAIGTEITDGQIINRNASWLSARMKTLGARTVLHLAVPDDRPRIRAALDLAEKTADVILVTGGLGPTSDDFTRDLVAEWAEAPLTFHDGAWASVVERLTSRGYPVHDFQKQQCYFPEGARLMWNAIGTAHGFALEARNKKIFVLPGPPREIEVIWNDHLLGELTTLTTNEDPIVTKSWDLLGLGESQVAAIASPLLESRDIEIGYRVHIPYVELKISAPRSRTDHLDLAASLIEEHFGSWIRLRDGEDAAEILARRLTKYESIEVVDQATGAGLIARLQGPLRDFIREKPWTFTSSATGERELTLFNRSTNDGKVIVGWRHGDIEKTSQIEPKMTAPAMVERQKQIFAEECLLWWLESLPSD